MKKIINWWNNSLSSTVWAALNPFGRLTLFPLVFVFILFFTLLAFLFECGEWLIEEGLTWLFYFFFLKKPYKVGPFPVPHSDE